MEEDNRHVLHRLFASCSVICERVERDVVDVVPVLEPEDEYSRIAAGWIQLSA